MRRALGPLGRAKLPTFAGAGRDQLGGAAHDLWRLSAAQGGAFEHRVSCVGPLYALLEAHPNLYVDTSILSNFMVLEEMAARFGADRLLFGTGAPRYEGAGSITALRYAALSEIERQAIAGGNLERLLGEVQR